MAPGSPPGDLASSVSKLSLETSSKVKAAAAPRLKASQAKKVPVVADSWEDEDVSSSDEAGGEGDDIEDDSQRSSPEEERVPGLSTSRGKAGTSAPPPTPMSPTYSKRPFSPMAATASGRLSPVFDLPYDGPSRDLPAAARPSDPKRPEKTDAVARRMIASALGMKVPKLSDEQRAYDRAVREKERRRREEEKILEKKREEEVAKARQAVWED
ncbi:hypothetical protein B0H63DRAFT_117298 [Podospora didyma]|uniref:Ubiquitin-like protein SMT3 n=1 Tax=Podospora didyma TaxID=330526 RepID=A0AAE0NZJ1_9PEZI|nr:hypothetical protein B0H63DRAFT_117298 [Podospora didyma]